MWTDGKHADRRPCFFNVKPIAYSAMVKSPWLFSFLICLISACSNYGQADTVVSSASQKARLLQSIKGKFAPYGVSVVPDGSQLCSLPPPMGHYYAYYRSDNNTICLSDSMNGLDSDTFEAVLVHEVVHLLQDCVTPNTFFGLASPQMGPIGSRVSIRPRPIPLSEWENNKWSSVWKGLEYDSLDVLQKEAFALQEHPERVVDELLPQLCRNRGGVVHQSSANKAYSTRSDFGIPWKVECVNGGFEAYQISDEVESQVPPNDSIYLKYAPFFTPPAKIVAEFILIVDGIEYPAKGYRYSFLSHIFVKGGGYEILNGQGGISFSHLKSDKGTSDPLISLETDKEIICSNSKYGDETDGFIIYHR